MENKKPLLNPVQSFGSNLIVTILAKNSHCPYCACEINANNYSIEHIHPKSQPASYKGNPQANYDCNLPAARKDDCQKDFFNLIVACRACNMRIGDNLKTDLQGNEIYFEELFAIACKVPTENEIVENLKRYYASNPNHKLIRKFLGLDYAPNKKLRWAIIEKVLA